MKRLYTDGNYIIADAVTIQSEYSKIKSVYTLRDGVYTIKEDLDKGELKIPIVDIPNWYDETGLIAYSEATLETFLRSVTGTSSNKTSTSIQNTVTVDRITSIKLLDANPNRIGCSFYNTGIEGVVIRYYPTAQDNNIEGYHLEAGASKEFHDVNYTGEISSIRSDVSGTQTSDIKLMEW